MAFSEFEIIRLEKILKKFCDENGPPQHLRSQLQLGFHIDSKNQCITITEIRPAFMNQSKKTEHHIAKTSYVKKIKKWKIYWMRGNLRWYQYEPCPETSSVEKFLKVIKDDAFGCFFG